MHGAPGAFYVEFQRMNAPRRRRCTEWQVHLVIVKLRLLNERLGKADQRFLDGLWWRRRDTDCREGGILQWGCGHRAGNLRGATLCRAGAAQLRPEPAPFLGLGEIMILHHTRVMRKKSRAA